VAVVVTTAETFDATLMMSSFESFALRLHRSEMHSQRTIENEIESSSFWFQKKRFKKQHE
jgi:hypothetical protein